MWLGVKLRLNTQKTRAQEIGRRTPITILGSIVKHVWWNLHDHLMNMRILTLIVNKIFSYELKIYETDDYEHNFLITSHKLIVSMSHIMRSGCRETSIWMTHFCLTVNGPELCSRIYMGLEMPMAMLKGMYFEEIKVLLHKTSSKFLIDLT